MAETVERIDKIERLIEQLVQSQLEERESMAELRKMIWESKEEYKEWKKELDEDYVKWKKELDEDYVKWKKELDEDYVKWRKEMEADREQWEKEMEADREQWEKEMKADREQWEKEMKAEREQWEKELEEQEKKSREEFRREIQADIKAMNKRWGDLANKMGTIVEDLIFPNFHILLKEHFNLPSPNMIAIRVHRSLKRENMTKEFDLIAVYEDEGLVFLNETKSTATKEYITRFADFIKSKDFFTFFPQYRGMTLVPVFSSIYLDERYVELLTEKNIFAVHIEGSILHLRNGETFREKYGL